MHKGWIRAYEEEDEFVGNNRPYWSRAKRAEFRSSFRTEIRKTKSANSEEVKKLKWGDEVELPRGLAKGAWTAVKSKTKTGFVKTAHLVQLAWVERAKPKKGYDGLSREMKLSKNSKSKILWGDLVQILNWEDGDMCRCRVRGRVGTLSQDDLMDKPLLEVYFVDVGQGDGLLLRTPDGRHMVIDGGLERTKQLTGKNAADFVDWKFFMDYGDSRIRLDSLMASHSDNDHYGGLHDLVRTGTVADRELDCVGVDIKTFHHPGLSRWSKVKNAIPRQTQGLGALADDAFVHLLNDRADAEASLEKNAPVKLSGPWAWFIRDILANSKSTKVERVIVSRNDIKSGKHQKLWPSKDGCDVFVLGPVSKNIQGKPALPDFGKKSYNTNGHSICLRLDFGEARILLTGDLNSESMKWLDACYGDRMGVWECDVAKACHHGSHDISYGFLEKMKPAATIISSGDAEGHAHPRPEIVGASAVTGFKNVDREADRLLTPLIYMTEIERSVSLGALNRIDFQNLPHDDQRSDGVILGRHLDELNDAALLGPDDQKKHDKAKAKIKKIKQDPNLSKAEKKTQTAAENKIIRTLLKIQKELLKSMESGTASNRIKVNFNLTIPNGPLSTENVRKRAWKSRIMEKNHYGLVNVRTDGKTIMCATLDETEHKWVTHSFPARFS